MSSFKGHDRNKVNDDPIEFRGPRVGGPQPFAPGAPSIGDGLVAALRSLFPFSGIDTGRALQVRPPPAHYPVGGQTVTITANATTVAAHVVGPNDGLTNILQWTSGDPNRSVRGMLSLVPGPPGQHVGDPFSAVWCLITMGTLRGKVSWWELAPALVPVEGTYLRVDAIFARCPKFIAVIDAGNLNAGQTPPGPIIPQWNFPHTATITANFFDEFSERYPSPSIIGTPQQPASLVTIGSFGTPQWQQPVILTSVELTNSNASDVYIGFSDGTGVNLSTVIVNGIIKVPAGSSVAVGQELLGSYGVGVCMFGVTTPGQPPYTNDTNDANVFATMRGISLQNGN